MGSGEAFGWLIADVLVHGHLVGRDPDTRDERYYLSRGLDPDHVTTFCPECCGPCSALAEYFNTPRGRAEADSYTRQLPAEYKRPDGGIDYLLPDGAVNWDWVERQMKQGFCPNHEK